MTTIYVSPQGVNPQYGYQNIVVEDDRSTLKGALWTYAAFKVGACAIGAGLATIGTAPLVLAPPLTVVPIAFGLTTIFLTSMTSSCIDNAAYHFGSRNVVILKSPVVTVG